MTVHIRAAAPEEAAALTDCAMRSKASWGYDAAFMDACRANLTVTPEAVDAAPTFVAENAGRIVGFYQLNVDAADLDSMFVEPSALRSGIGRALWEHCLSTAAAADLKEMTIASDPFAEAFYLAMGAARIGEIESDVVPGRWLPLLKISI